MELLTFWSVRKFSENKAKKKSENKQAKANFISTVFQKVPIETAKNIRLSNA